MSEVGDIPQLNGAVVVAADQHAPVTAERHRIYAVLAVATARGMTEQARASGVADIPQPDRAVGVAAGQRLAIGAKRHDDRTAYGVRGAGQGMA